MQIKVQERLGRHPHLALNQTSAWLCQAAPAAHFLTHFQQIQMLQALSSQLLSCGVLSELPWGCIEPQTSTFYLFYFYREETICVNCLNHSKSSEYHLTGSVPCNPVIRASLAGGDTPSTSCLANTAYPTLRHQVMLDGRTIGACYHTGPTLESSE